MASSKSETCRPRSASTSSSLRRPAAPDWNARSAHPRRSLPGGQALPRDQGDAAPSGAGGRVNHAPVVQYRHQLKVTRCSMSPADLGQGQPGTSAVRHRADVSGGVAAGPEPAVLMRIQTETGQPWTSRPATLPTTPAPTTPGCPAPITPMRPPHESYCARSAGLLGGRPAVLPTERAPMPVPAGREWPVLPASTPARPSRWVLQRMTVSEKQPRHACPLAMLRRPGRSAVRRHRARAARRPVR